ncbi:MAG TPA: DNA polymerase/3'-5' exonuclease PolX [Myxococcota bacterium]|nr:DNA polymerase/3'-5' exonuclease PolX [Myxococcota bacterium]
MKVTNDMIANQFNELADLLEIDGANPFRIRAYRTAARNIGSLGKPVEEMIKQGQDLTDIPGIGSDLAQKIQEIVKTGRLALLKGTATKFPKQLTELMKLSGLGPKRVKMLHDKLGIKSLAQLKKAIAKGELKKLRGFGETLIAKVQEAVEHREEYKKTTKLTDTELTADQLLAHLKASKAIKDVAVAGSFRRRKEVVGDLDILVSATNAKNAIEQFIKFPLVKTVTARGTTRAAVRLASGLQVDLRVVPKKSFGAALLYFTGSKAHNIALRRRAVEKHLKLNEYGLFEGKSSIAGATEKQVYRALGLPYIEPELREDRGEIEIALHKNLPKLIELDDIRGDLHTHTSETDGTESLEAMAKAAASLGYEYVAITDHSKHLTVTNGLNEKRLRKQIEAIDRLNLRLKGITVLKSIELDILEDGTLDLDDSVLKELDLTVCSIHSRFNLPEKKQTERIIRAMDNRYFNILAHPTGRLVNLRPAYQVDIERIMKAAVERGCYLEINGQPERLDLDDIHCQMAKDLGLKLAISTDAHSSTHFAYMKYGIYQARRGFLEKADVINTRTLSQLRKLLKR